MNFSGFPRSRVASLFLYTLTRNHFIYLPRASVRYNGALDGEDNRVAAIRWIIILSGSAANQVYISSSKGHSRFDQEFSLGLQIAAINWINKH